MAELPIHNHNNTVQGAHRDFEEEEGSSTNASTQVEQGSQHALIDEAKKVKKLFDDFDDAFRDPENTSFYVISQNWINEWKKYVSYDNVIQGLEPEKEFFGQEAPGKINEDIVDANPKFLTFTGYPEDKSFTNVLLRDGLQEGRDYKLITGPTWRYLHKQYGGIPVKRPCKTFPNGQRQVEVRLKKIELVPVNNAFLRSVDHERARDFKVFIFQAPSFRTIKDFKSDLIDVCNSDIGKKWFDNSSPLSYSYSLFADDTLRFWKLDPSVTLSDMFSFVKGKCKKSTSYEYRIEFKGTYLLKDPEITLEEAEIADNDYVFLEAREQGRGWNFVGDNAPTIDKCEFCNKYEELPIQCACKKASYCSEECKFRDKRFHQMKCDKTTEEEEEQNKQMVMTASSRKGLCGLQNLGNTCFMNSGLQCLSNIKELTEYFLSDKYLKEVNETNPLGTKGKLVKKYGMFLKNLWFGASAVHSPWSLKHAISEFQPMFSGYQQHDSQELLSFLLDGIHEDLNRVKNKPFTETIESESQPDYEAGLKSWENHLKRNQSIIVDLLHGQFKSQITCPTCSRISITFDPFNCVSLPIPTKTEKEIDFIFLHANHKEKPVKVKISFNPNTHTVAQLKAQTAEILKKDPNTFYFVFMSQHSKQVITEEAKTMTNDIRKKKKVHSLFAYEIAQEDLHAHPDELYHVDYSTSKGGLNYFGRPTRKKFAYRRTVCLRKKYTSREVYIKVFKQYRNLWTEALPEDQQEAWSNLSDEEAFKQVWEDVEEKPFKILLVTNARIFHECYFCGEKKCDNCELRCDSGLTVDDLLNQIKDPEFKLEFEIYFEHAPEYLDLERLDSYTDLSKEKSAEDEKDKNISIYRCFEQFEEPEVLGEENAWYCSRCKAHQRATKKMEIYKAPPILMIHLKRFKSTGMSSFASKSKISAKIDFPEKDFDISEYVLNHELPLDYPVERIVPGYHDGETLNGATMSTTAASAEDGAAQGAEEERKMEVEPATVTPSKNHREKIEEEVAKTNGKSALLYDLFGVVNHYGNLGFGHYTAYAKNHLNGKWHCFDDSSVSDEDADSICTPASYVLFYKRKDWTFNY